MNHDHLTNDQLTAAREDALDAFSQAAKALEDLFNDLAVMRYPSGDYAVRYAQLPALKAQLITASDLFTSLHNELARREDALDVPMVCTACRKPAEQTPGQSFGSWWHVEVDDFLACPLLARVPVRVMVAAGNENIPVKLP
jgi:hypothetical protein